MNKAILTLMLLFAWMSPVFAQAPDSHAEVERGDRSQTPYFIIPDVPEDKQQEALPLESTEADVDIAGTIAKVTVRQVFRNRGSKPIEAIYVFPGSTRAAVFGLTMRIGEREIKATIKEKEQARADYEQARSEGKTASLLEQQRPNVFQMNVANILPGEVVEVELNYVEALAQVDGEYEFSYPAVVGPRYVRKEDAAQTGWAHQKYMPFGAEAPFKWDLNVSLDAGMPITAFKSTSHEVLSKQPSPNQMSLTLKPHKDNAIKDFVLRYSLRGKEVNQGLLLFENKGENFFLAMVQPPAEVKPEQRPAREYIFILDVSGSMHGYPIQTAKNTLSRLLQTMSPRDHFNVLTFSGGSNAFAPRSMPATPENIAKFVTFMDTHLHGGGGTELLPALQHAFRMPSQDTPARSFVAITDGYVSVEKEAFEIIRKNLDKASFFAFGIGNSINRHLIEGMARAGQGEAFVVQGGEDAARHSERFAKYIESPVLAQLKVQFKGFEAYDVTPSVLPTVYGERPVMIFGKYRGAAKGSIELSGIGAKGPVKTTLSVSNFKASPDNEALRYLWARAKVQELSDSESFEGKSQAKAITELGLRYSLMTQHTSFVAIDSESRTDEQALPVHQPLPSPIENQMSMKRMAMAAPTSRATFDSSGGSYGGSGPMVLGSAGGSARSRNLRQESMAAPTLDAPAEKEEAKPELSGYTIRISKAPKAVSGSVHAQLQQHQAELERILKAHNLRSGVQLIITLNFNAQGQLEGFQLVKGNLGSRVQADLKRVFQKFALGNIKQATSVTVDITTP